MLRNTFVLAMALLLATTAAAADTLYVDLSGIDTAFPELSAAQRQQLKDKIIADIEANFLVAGVDINVTTDPAVHADRTVNFNDSLGSRARPGGGTSYFYGRWRHGSSSCDVYLDNFTDRHGDDYKTDGEWDLDKLANGLGRTAAHEVAHSYSAGHNRSSEHNKMTEGGLVPSNERANTEWIFDDHSSEVMQENLGQPPCDSTTDYDADYIVPTFYDAPLFPFDFDEYPGFDAELDIFGLYAEEFELGWYSYNVDFADGDPERDFVYKAGAREPDGPPFLITFLPDHHDAIQFLLRGAEGSPWADMWFPMSEADILFDDPTITPDGVEVYRNMQICWDIDGDHEWDYIASFNANDVYPPYGASYNGFRRGHVWFCPGDLDHNLMVNLADLQILLANYGTIYGATFEEGDMDGDNDVDLSDLQRLLSAYGSICEPEIMPGQDMWVTPCGTTHHDFSTNPLPADFFGPGSDPFEGTISLAGDLIAPDTVMDRIEGMTFESPWPSSIDIPIEISQMTLMGCEPVIVTIDSMPTEWAVRVTHMAGMAPWGTMTVTKEHQNGGTFDATFFIQPIYEFERLDLPGAIVIYDTLAAGLPPYEFNVTDAPWLTNELFDMGTIDGFVAGVELDPNSVPCGVDVRYTSPAPEAHDHGMRPAGHPLCPQDP